MKLKKLACAALAGTLALSLAATAFADAEVHTTEYESTMTVPTISVTVPDSGTVVLNPYQMSVTPDGGTETTDQIISATNFISNESNVPMIVSASVTGTLPSGKSDVSFSKTSTQNATKPTNSIFMYFEVSPADDGTTEPTWLDGYVSSPSADQKIKQIVVQSTASKSVELLTLEAGDTTPTYAAYRLTGDVVSAPTRAWAEDDTVSASIAFTFTPTALAAG